MKNKFFIVLLALSSGMVFTDCNDLDLQPLDAITEDSFYKTSSDFRGAILASYSSMQSFNGTSTENLGECAEWWKMTLMTTDDITFDDQQLGVCATNQAMDNFTFTASDKAFQSVFTHVYQGIFRANLVIDKLALENELEPDEKAAFEAEAKFLRAWFHFQAYKFWGGQAPLALETRRDIDDIALPNSTPEEMINAILADFQAAADGLPESWGDADLGRATAWAAKAYIGKVNVYGRRFPAAVTALSEVYEMGPYSLMSNYEDVFSFDFENNMESIFEMQYASNSDDNGWVLDDNHSENFKASQGIMRAWWQDASAGRDAPGGGLGVNVPTTELINAFEDGDSRKATTIYTDGDTYYAAGVEAGYDPSWSPTGATMRKYRGLNVAKMNPVNFAIDYNNERLYRFADVILLYAEALVESGGDMGLAADLIDEVRDRSCPDCDDADGDLLEEIQKERRVEFAFEGHRLFDLVRWGIAEDVFAEQGINFKTWGSAGDYPAIFPLPQSEIDRGGGKLTQVQ